MHQATSDFPGEMDVTWEYGGHGKPWSRTADGLVNYYRYDQGWNVVNEDWAFGMLHAHVFEPHRERGDRLATSMMAYWSTTYHAYHDHLGSIRRWRYQNQNSMHGIEFEPYGGVYAETGSEFMRTFAMHEWDPALNQYRAPYRDYSPAMGRWTTPDPLGMVDGPNVYAYVGGDAINQIDRKGLSILPAIPPVLLAALVACGLYVYRDAFRGPQGNYVQHCAFGCKLARCTGDRSGWLAYAINWYWEEFMERIAGDPHDHQDNEAARFGATDCSRSCRSCEGCCGHVFD